MGLQLSKQELIRLREKLEKHFLRYQQSVENGEIAAVWLKEDEVSTVKRLYYDGNESVELKSANLNNKDAKSIVRSAEAIIVYGKLVRVIRDPK